MTRRLNTPKHKRLVQTRVADSHFRWLVRTANAHGISVAELVRKLIAEKRKADDEANSIESALRDIAKAIRETGPCTSRNMAGREDSDDETKG